MWGSLRSMGGNGDSGRQWRGHTTLSRALHLFLQLKSPTTKAGKEKADRSGPSNWNLGRGNSGVAGAEADPKLQIQ